MIRPILRRIFTAILIAGLMLLSGAVFAGPDLDPLTATRPSATIPTSTTTATELNDDRGRPGGDGSATVPTTTPAGSSTIESAMARPVGPATTIAPTTTTAPSTPSVSHSFPSSSGADWYGSGIKGVNIRPRTPTTTDWALGPISAPRSGTIDSLALYFVFTTEGNYFAGSGGINRFSLRPDSNGQPGQTILGEFTISNPMQNIWSDWATVKVNDDHFRLDSPVSLTAGTRYWIVAENLHPDPANNWVGINAIAQGDGAPGTVYVHMETAPGSGVFERFAYPGEPGWFVGLFDLTYQQGGGFGQGYWFALFDQAVGGDLRAREVFTPSANHTISSLRLWVKGVSGSGALTATLSTNGTVVAQTSASAAGAAWLTFPMKTTLQAGATYFLEFSAPSGAVYTFSVLRQNSGWSDGSHFADGYADYFNGSAWLGGWPIWGSTGTEGDLMFSFTTGG
jgi:hypothetical protein